MTGFGLKELQMPEDNGLRSVSASGPIAEVSTPSRRPLTSLEMFVLFSDLEGT
jgi:hypothetical protein